jgi:4-diphosphocytidyl-2C-methyl-D-erythritol kinase
VEVLGAGSPRTFLLIVPPFALKTAEVYARLSFPLTSPRNLGTMTHEIAERKLRTGELLFNRLEEPAFALEPQLHEIREGARRGGVSVLLTGSGSCLFGLTQGRADVSQLAGFLKCRKGQAFAQLVRNLPPWWSPWRKEGGSGNHRCTRSPGGEGK